MGLKIFKSILFLIFSLTLQCNAREHCQANSGYENYNGCAVLIGVYNNLSEERKQQARLDVLLGVCLLTHVEIERCKKESTRWPLPE